MVRPSDFVLTWNDIDRDDVHHVGEHAAKIGNLSNHFTFPHGFVVSANAYFHFLEQNNLNYKIAHLLNSINFDKDQSVWQVSHYIKNLIKSSKIPDQLARLIILEYEKINAPVYLRTHFISGETKQNIKDYGAFDHVIGEAMLLDAIRLLWAHIYSPELIKFRNENKIDHLKTGVATSIHKKIFSGIKGKIWTNDPLGTHAKSIIIEIENLPIQYVVDRENFNLTHRKHNKNTVIIYVKDGSVLSNKINSQQIITLANLGLNYEKMHYFPHEIEFVIDNGIIYLLDSKPITAHAKN